MNDDQLLRYSRQILLPAIGAEGQQRLLDSSALIIGAGGLGCPAAMYLATAGVGRLVIADHDQVDLSNLQRQIAHGTTDIGKNKTQSLQETLQALNPDCRVDALPGLQDEAAFLAAMQGVDIVLDCTDNFTTRFAINAACIHAGIPLVSGAAIRFEAQISVIDPRQPDAPCYRCLYPATDEVAETCAENGVIAPLVGAIGSLQALEAMKLLMGIGQSLSGRLLILDAMTLQWREMRFTKDPHCPVCRH